ncbi:DUF3019 domain-containing protein [Alteromonas sp. a30]|uniref:DUF3019 domain-containing protein n=1 Tax=Alteromonas sp. a30 TaxID=2730917 RepID=UPI00227FD57C|nr:DUF3019 domain-containing protein [Alteromonas sp. a30]MCY7294784.1 DUF3019 domain-containing protein [Alteromonas sp. a30]
MMHDSKQYLLTFFLFSISLLMLPIPLRADSGLTLKTLIPTLVASPGICELDVGETVCEMRATLIWEVPKAGHFCLKEAESKSLLRCWKNSWSGTHQIHFTSSNSQTFILTRGPSGTIAANTVVAVTGTIEQRMRSRRRRGLWSLF